LYKDQLGSSLEEVRFKAHHDIKRRRPIPPSEPSHREVPRGGPRVCRRKRSSKKSPPWLPSAWIRLHVSNTFTPR